MADLEVWHQPRRLYVAEFKNGVVKVGVTAQPKSWRMTTLRFRHYRPERYKFFAKIDCGYVAERDLLRRMARIGQIRPLAAGVRSREWFTAVPFKVACQLAEQVTWAAICYCLPTPTEKAA